jgi:hypothetical protein
VSNKEANLLFFSITSSLIIAKSSKNWPIKTLAQSSTMTLFLALFGTLTKSE